MKCLMIWLSLLFLVDPAFASKIIGNGGDVVVCRGRSPRVQLLDFYEATKLANLKLVEPDGETYVEKVKSLSRKVSARFPVLSRIIIDDLELFESRKRIMDDVQLEDISDSYHTVLPPDCRIAQIANQKAPLFPRHPWFIIDAALWSGLSEFHKAGLVVHEILYRHGLRYGLEHSLGVRYMVGLLFSAEFEEVSDHEWVQAYLNTLIRHYEKSGLRIPLFSGEPSSCEARPGSANCRDIQPVRPATFRYNEEALSAVEYQDLERVEFSSGMVKASILAKHLKFESREGRNQVYFEGKLIVSLKKQFFSRTTFEVKGHLDPKSGKFCGTQSALKPDGQYLYPPSEYCDSLSKMSPAIKPLRRP